MVLLLSVISRWKASVGRADVPIGMTSPRALVSVLAGTDVLEVISGMAASNVENGKKPWGKRAVVMDAL
jgi:hypothetical protein